MAEKDQRITQLKSELHEKTMELEKLSKEREEVTRWKSYYATTEKVKASNDKYIKEAEEKEEKLKELTNRIAALESELRSKDQEMDLIKAKLSKEKEEVTRWKSYHATTEKVKASNDKYIKEAEDKEEKLKELTDRIAALESELGSKNQEMDLIKANNSQLSQELHAKDEQMKAEYMASCAQLRQTFHAYVTEKEKELHQITNSNYQLGQDLRAKDELMKEYIAGCKQLQFILADKEEELRGMKTRVAYISEKQVKMDQRKVEDTAASNRPSDVEKDFVSFFDGDRIDAFDTMQEHYGSEEEIDVMISYPRLACIIFEASYEQTKETKEAVLDLFKVITAVMIDRAPKMGQEYSSRVKGRRLPHDIHIRAMECKPELEYPTDVLDALALSMKGTAHKCSLESLEQDVREKIREKWQLWLTQDQSCNFTFSNSLLRKLNNYIKACIRLTWRMVTQVPPMQLEYQSSTLKDIHKNLGYHSSPHMCLRRTTTEGQISDKRLEIACYLWPALLDGGGKLIRAGEVLCKVNVEQ